MKGDFLPRYRCVPAPGGFRPSYTLFEGEGEKVVPRCSIYATEGEARKAAQEYVRQKLNPPIRSHAFEPDADEIIRQQWRQEKAMEAEAERDQVFGAGGPARLFRKGKEIVVERTRRRARA